MQSYLVLIFMIKLISNIKMDLPENLINHHLEAIDHSIIDRAIHGKFSGGIFYRRPIFRLKPLNPFIAFEPSHLPFGELPDVFFKFRGHFFHFFFSVSTSVFPIPNSFPVLIFSVFVFAPIHFLNKIDDCPIFQTKTFKSLP